MSRFLLAGALLVTLPASAQPPAELQARLDTWNRGESGGIVAAWVDAGGAAFAHSGRYGADDARPLTPDTPFQIGSVTKIFTALLFAETERAGRVKRDDPAANHLLPAGDPDRAKLDGITLLMLTTHTAGLPTIPSDFDGGDRRNYTSAQLLAAFRREGPKAKPGSPVSYSNFGVQLLGQSLAAAWGTSYPEALRAHVLAPLGLRHTSLALAGQPLPADLAPGQQGGQAVAPWTFDAMAPSGAIVSTARDLATVLSFCLGRTESPLRAALTETMRPQRPVPGGGQIGFGWFITADPARPIYWHNGATAGYHAFFAFCPATGQGVALLSNSDKPCDPVGLALLGVKPVAPAPAKIANATEYVGHYALTPAFAIAITADGGELFEQATNQQRLPLRRLAGDRFAVGGVKAEISFERDPAGKVVALILQQNGGATRGVRRE